MTVAGDTRPSASATSGARRLGRWLRRRPIVPLLLLAALIRVGVVLTHDPGLSYGQRPFLDETDYDALAVNLLRFGRFAVFTEGHLAQGTRPPGYPLLLAVLYGVLGHRLLVARLANAALGVLAVWLSYRLVGRLTAGARWSASAALAAAAVHALSGLPVLSEVRLTGEELGIVVVLALAVALEGLRRGGTWKRALAAGALAAALIHVRPVFLPLVPVVAWAAYLCLRTKASRRAAARWATVVAGVMVLGGVPWMVRSKVVLGRVVPLSSVSGWHLLAGARSLDGLPVDALRRYAFGYPDKREGELFWQGVGEALRTMAGHPAANVGAGLVRLWRSWGVPGWYRRFWRPRAYVVPVPLGSAGPGALPRWWVPLVDFEGLVYLGVMFALWAGVSGRWRRARWGWWWRRCGPLLLLVAGYVAIHALAIPFVQYRLFVEPLVVAFGVVAVGGVLRPAGVPGGGRSWAERGRAGVGTAVGLPRWGLVVGVVLLAAGWWPAYRWHWARRGPAAVEEAQAREYFARRRPQAFSRWQREPVVTFEEVRRYQYGHGGAVDGLVGRWVLWPGELGYSGPGFRYLPERARSGASGPVEVWGLRRRPGWSVVRLVVGRDVARGVFGVGDVRVSVPGEVPVSPVERPGAVLGRIVGTDLFGGVVIEADDVLLR